MAITFGGHVPLKDIVGRDETVATLWAELEHHSVRMTEFRRSGKSTLLRLAESKTPKGWLCVRTSVQDARSTLDLVDATLQALHKHSGPRRKLLDALADLTEPVTSVQALGVTVALNKDLRARPVEALRTVLANLNQTLEAKKKRLAIMWDEFPDAIEAIAANDGPQAAKDILSLLRALRESDDSQRVRWVLTGSVGFHHVTGALKATDLINELVVVELPPLTRQWARWLAESLLLGIGREAQPVQSQALADASGGIPFVLELMVKQVQSDKAALPETLDAANQLLRTAAGGLALGANWTPLLERVDGRYQDQAAAAEDVLDLVARTPAGAAEIRRVLANYHAVDGRVAGRLLDLLCEDHYLTYQPDVDMYWWRHAPLRVLWQARRQGKAKW
jgi:hypothetical protein